MLNHLSDKIKRAIDNHDSCLLLGLDPDITKILAYQHLEPLLAIDKFCIEILKATSDYICGIKIQMAYFECYGSAGIALVEKLSKHARDLELLVIIDGKRSDIGSSAMAYAQAYLGKDSAFACDCLTINPWLGSESIEPFVELAYKNNKGVFVLVKTSNSTADQLQRDTSQLVASMINNFNNQNSNNLLSNDLSNSYLLNSYNYGPVGAVIGATRGSEELSHWRKIMPQAWLLTPGVGVQGGDFDAVLNLRDQNGYGVLLPLSRTVLYASKNSDYHQAAKQEIKNYWHKQRRK